MHTGDLMAFAGRLPCISLECLVVLLPSTLIRKNESHLTLGEQSRDRGAVRSASLLSCHADGRSLRVALGGRTTG